ncbi:MAG TPA: hypothetical protein VGR20_13955, partial [Acidimicrobiia bacterium]|nr:hypothetical protein [Acidimicrobiia bacterium]
MLAAGAMALVGVTFQTPAGASLSFTATAIGDGLRLTMTVPNGPGTDQPIDGGGPTAQALVSSSGASKAFASFPYPGEIAVTTPGLLAAVGVPGVPQYPAYQGSDYPSVPNGHFEAPGYRLDASSEASGSKGEAAAGAPDGRGGSVRSAAAVVPQADGSVVATGEFVASNLHAGDVVVGEGASRASVAYGDDGVPRRSSQFTVTGLSVGGVLVALGPEGLSLGDHHSAIPAASSVLTPLGGSGVKLEYLQPEETEHGIISAGLRITLPGSPATGGGALTVVLGRASAAVNGVALSADAATGAAPDVPVMSPEDSSTAPAAPGGSDPAPAVEDRSGLSTTAPASAFPLSGAGGADASL